MLDKEALNRIENNCKYCKQVSKHECSLCPYENAKYALKQLIEKEKNNG